MSTYQVRFKTVPDIRSDPHSGNEHVTRQEENYEVTDEAFKQIGFRFDRLPCQGTQQEPMF
jgi:hypothetical protein